MGSEMCIRDSLQLLSANGAHAGGAGRSAGALDLWRSGSIGKCTCTQPGLSTTMVCVTGVACPWPRSRHLRPQAAASCDRGRAARANSTTVPTTAMPTPSGMLAESVRVRCCRRLAHDSLSVRRVATSALCDALLTDTSRAVLDEAVAALARLRPEGDETVKHLSLIHI